MLTGQFHELSSMIGSGVPVKIYKLDNNQTSKVIQVDQFTDPKDIPYPWEGDSWANSFIGYSISRNQMETPGVITSPTILYCFYDADVSLTFKLPLPESKAITIDYGKGQRPQLRDITGSNSLVKQAAIDRGISFSLPDGTPIDAMRKPVENTTVEVVLCNRERDVTKSSAPYFGYTYLHYTTSDGGYSNDKVTIVDGEVPIHSVSYHVPQIPVLNVEARVTSSVGSVPYKLSTFEKIYDIAPVADTMSAKAYYVNHIGSSITCRLLEFPEAQFGRVGMTMGSTTSSTPTTYPSTPSIGNKGSWTTPGGDARYGVTMNKSLASDNYLPMTLNAELKAFKGIDMLSITALDIEMSRAPKLKSGTTNETTLHAWLRTNVHADEQNTVRWWMDNYQKVFLSSN